MPRKLSEELTRKELIDPQLEKAGWYLRDHSRVKTEITACPAALCGVDGYDAEPWNGVTDYTLYRENGEVLAEAQLTYYVTEIEKHQSFRPFGFLANGLESYYTATYMAVVWLRTAAGYVWRGCGGAVVYGEGSEEIIGLVNKLKTTA